MSPWTAPARLLGLAALLCVCVRAASPAQPVPLDALLTRFDRAMVDPGVPSARILLKGTISGGGSEGTFTQWIDGERTREDDTLGPGTQQQFDLGGRAFTVDMNGIVRELRGVLLRRIRTDRLLDSGKLSAAAGCCSLSGETSVAGKAAYEIVVRAPGGEPETVFLDRASALPIRLSYEDEDGITTVDFEDWRSAGGRRFALRRIESNGDHRYDVKQSTTQIDPVLSFADETFRIPPTRLIDAAAAQTLELSVAGGVVTLPVEIAGKRYTFLLDSGSQDIVLDRSLAKQLGLHEQGDLQVLGSARTGGLRFSSLAELSVGTAHMRKLVVDTLDLRGALGTNVKIDGILGYPFFGQSLVELDLADKRLRFGRPGAWPIAGERIPVELDRSLPEAAMQVKSIPGNVLIDTGNAADLLLFRRFVDRNPGIVATSFATGSSFGVGGQMSTFHATLPTLRIGSFTLRDVPSDVVLSSSGAFADLFMAGDAGFGILKRFVITFDFPDDALYFAASPIR